MVNPLVVSSLQSMIAGSLTDGMLAKSEVVETSYLDSRSDGSGVGLDTNMNEESLFPACCEISSIKSRLPHLKCCTGACYIGATLTSPTTTPSERSTKSGVTRVSMTGTSTYPFICASKEAEALLNTICELGSCFTKTDGKRTILILVLVSATSKVGGIIL